MRSGPRMEGLRWGMVIVLAILALVPALPSPATGWSRLPPAPSPPRFAAISPGDAPVAPTTVAMAAPSYTWSTAQIFYGPGDPAGRLFGLGAVMAVDDRVQNTVSFGGRAVDGLSNITLVYENATNGTWWYAGSPISPPARANASFAGDPQADLAVLYGGLANVTTSRTLADTWVYNFVNETWVNVTRAQAPPIRENAAFAIDPAVGVGLLFGGIAPRYGAGGTNGTVLWNDSWELNLSSWSWSPVVLQNAPPPEFGASMLWDPVLGAFVLFGGCGANGCTNGVWTYVPGGGAWSHPSLGGSPPSSRGSPAFVWDPLDNVSLLFGGFSPGADGPVALGGTFSLDGPVTQWSPILSTGGPPPTFGSASAFSSYPGCVGMWVQGGSPALSGIITNVSVLEPTTSLVPNCFTPFGGGTGNGPPAACSNTSAHVTVQARDALTGLGLAGADVEVKGACGASQGLTGAQGFVNLTEAAPDLLTITVSRSGYHTASTTATFTGRVGEVVRLSLYPFPALHVQVAATTLAGTSPLVGALVQVNDALVLGRTSAGGWVNSSSVPVAGSTVNVTALAAGFSSATARVPLPFTGIAEANLTLLAYGEIDLHITDNATGTGLSGATLALTFVDPLGANTTVYATGPSGWFNTSLQAGNYSVSVAREGYFSNGTVGPFYHGWVQPTVIQVQLAKVYGADVSVRVYDAATGAPVPNASVTFGGSPAILSSPLGWANASDLGPAGFLRIEVRAWGYYPNDTTVVLAPYLILRDVELPLMPAPPCSPFADCPSGNGTAAPPAFSLLPPGGAVRLVVLAVPVAVAAVGAIALGTRAGRSAIAASDTGRPHPKSVQERSPTPPG